MGLLLFFAVSIQPELYAQNLQNKIQNKVKLKARKAVDNSVSTVRTSARIKVKGTKRALKSSLKGGRGRDEGPMDPTLDELIEDDEVKSSIYDNTNKKRYVELLREWTTMPSDADLALKRIQDSLNNIKLQQQSQRVAKRVWDDSRPLIIFGWHPHWMGEIYRGYDYDLFNVISYYSYDINPDNGAPQNPDVMAGFLASDFVSVAHEKQVSALLSVTCHGEQNVTRFLSQNMQAQQRFLDSIIFILDSTNADGLDINFKGVNAAVKDDFFKFIRVLSTTVQGVRGDTSFIFLSVPAYDPENIYDISKLQNFVDIFVVKSFEMHQTPDGFKKIPPSPLNYSRLTGEPDIRSTVDRYIANLGPLYTDRLILALPYFGTRWVSDPITEEVLDMEHINYGDIQFDFVMHMDDQFRYPGARLDYDSAQTSHVFKYYDYTGIDTTAGDLPNDVTIYFDDTISLRKKYRYLIDARLGGVGLQFLGNDSGFDHLQDLLYAEFTETIKKQDELLADVHEKSNLFRDNSVYALAVLLYFAIFISIGLCAALFNKKTRQALFVSGRFRLLYMAFFTLLMLLLGGYMGLFDGPTMPLVVGIVFGGAMSWLAWRSITKKKSLTP